MTQTLARGLAAACRARGVRRAFGVPGGASSLDVIDALATEGIDFVLTHGETAATLMAAVSAELGGAPGVVVTGVGPGAASAVNGVAYAALERAPVLLVTDALAEPPAGHHALHQRFDQKALFAPLVKAYAKPEPGDGLGQIDSLLDTAAAHPAGPVQLDLTTAAATAPGRARLRQSEVGEDGSQVIRPRHAGRGARPARRLGAAPHRRRHGDAREGGECGAESARAGARLPGNDHLQGQGRDRRRRSPLRRLLHRGLGRRTLPRPGRPLDPLRPRSGGAAPWPVALRGANPRACGPRRLRLSGGAGGGAEWFPRPLRRGPDGECAAGGLVGAGDCRAPAAGFAPASP